MVSNYNHHARANRVTSRALAASFIRGHKLRSIAASAVLRRGFGSMHLTRYWAKHGDYA